MTVSLEESVVLVWKVGGGFTSLFYPGLPPKQGAGGRSGEQPWKTLPFNVGDEGEVKLVALFLHIVLICFFSAPYI